MANKYYDFLFGEKKEDKDFKPIEKLGEKGIVIANPNSPIHNASSSPVEVPNFVAPFRGNTGLRKMQNMLATATVTISDELRREITEAEDGYSSGIGRYTSAFNPDDNMKREAILRMREYEEASYTGRVDLDELSKPDKEIEIVKKSSKNKKGKTNRIIRIS